MSTTRCSATIPLSPGQVPSPLTSLWDATPLFDPATSLSGASRNDWFEWMAGKVIDAHGLAHLEHLREPIALLAHDQLDAAIADLQGLLQHWQQSPLELVVISGQTAWSEAEIRAALDAPATLNPGADSDDGDDVPYFVAYLKGHLQVLERARESGCCVVHGQTPKE